MKIAYIVVSIASSGVHKKVFSQTHALNQIAGVDAHLYVYTPHQSPSDKRPEYVTFITKKPSIDLPIIRSYQFFKAIYADILSKSDTENWDFIYFRGCPANPLLLNFLRKSKSRVIFELNSIALQEAIIAKKPIRGRIIEYYAKKALKNAAGFVSVSHQIRNYYNELTNHQTPSVTISNGINVKEYRLHRPPLPDKKTISLGIAAQFAPWHGFDRVIEGLHAYKGNTSFRIIAAGKQSPLVKSYQMQIKSYGLDACFAFPGEIEGGELDVFYSQIQIGISTLAPHRLGMNELCPLKTREYLARGIPFIVGYKDVDLPKHADARFYLQVPNSDSPLDFASIEHFYQTISSQKDMPAVIRAFAEDTVDMPVKMQQVVEFLQQL